MSAEGVALYHEPRPLAELETVIERGLQTFVAVGEALLEIRERRLYRETHDSFEAYCRERWRWTRGRANQMIRASEVAGLLDTPVSTEAQARQLGRLRDDLRGMREVWDEVRAEHGDDATAADVREAVDRRLDVPRPREGQLTVGDVRDAIRAGFDEEGLAEDEALRRHVDAMARVRITWLRFMGDKSPGVFLDGLDRAGVESLTRDLDCFISWLQEAREATLGAHRPRIVQAAPDVLPPTERHAAMLKAIDDAQHILKEPEHEKVYYTLSRFRLSMHVDPCDIAEVSSAPAQDAPSWAALAAWVTAIAEAMQTRANGLRVIGDRQP